MNIPVSAVLVISNGTFAASTAELTWIDFTDEIEHVRIFPRPYKSTVDSSRAEIDAGTKISSCSPSYVPKLVRRLYENALFKLKKEKNYYVVVVGVYENDTEAARLLKDLNIRSKKFRDVGSCFEQEQTYSFSRECNNHLGDRTPDGECSLVSAILLAQLFWWFKHSCLDKRVFLPFYSCHHMNPLKPEEERVANEKHVEFAVNEFQHEQTRPTAAAELMDVTEQQDENP
ncbi:hypothetical protein HDE_12950 [Halotydeus destructor]|nr:hypothetical protein HDE_12950 [Halotydeus destructor]